MRRDFVRGFTIAETLVSISILTVAVIGTTKIVASGRRALVSVDQASGSSYFQDVLATRGTLVATNLLFWMKNVSNGCVNAGYFLAGEVPPGVAASPFKSFIEADFLAPFDFDGHLITPFTSWANASSVPGLAALKGWYNAFLASPGVDPANLKDPVAAMVRRCVTATDRLTPSTNFTGKSEFRFCVLMSGSGTPLARTTSQSGSTAQMPSLVVGEVFAQTIDGYSGLPLGCVNKDLTVIDDIVTNRTVLMSVFIGEIRDYKASIDFQSRIFTSRSFTAPKTRRMLINCEHCINIADPAFQYECRDMIDVRKCEIKP